MTSFWIAAIGIIGTLAGAVLTQWLQGRATETQSQQEERRRINDFRREALAQFADALMSYRRAQLHNWHEAQSLSVDSDQTSVAGELRELRARAWSAFYRVQLLWRDQVVVDGASRLVEAVTNLKKLEDAESVGDSADQVRDDLSDVMNRGRESLLDSEA